MTVRINFLPKTYQPPKQLGPKEWAVAGAVTVAAVATTVFYMGTFASTARLETQVLTDQTKLQTVRTHLTQAAELKAREDQIARAEMELRALSGRPWSAVLLTLRDMTPQHVTWTSLTVTGNEVTLKAWGRSLVDVAQLLGGLVDLNQVDQVTLHYVNESGLPVSVTTKGGDKNAQIDAARALGSFRQLEFEMVITLARTEGGLMPNGA